MEANPRCLEQRAPSGKGLLERLPLPSWKGQALQAAKDDKEPPYSKILSRLLSFKLASIVELTPPPPSTANLQSRKVKAAQTLLSMYGYLYAAWDTASNAAGIAGRNAVWDAALNAAKNAAGDAVRNSATNAARDAAVIAARNAVWLAATNAANEAITQLFAQSPADAPPSEKLIGKAAYRSAELTAQLSMLKQSYGESLRKRKDSFLRRLLLPCSPIQPT